MVTNDGWDLLLATKIPKEFTKVENIIEKYRIDPNNLESDPTYLGYMATIDMIRREYPDGTDLVTDFDRIRLPVQCENNFHNAEMNWREGDSLLYQVLKGQNNGAGVDEGSHQLLPVFVVEIIVKEKRVQANTRNTFVSQRAFRPPQAGGGGGAFPGGGHPLGGGAAAAGGGGGQQQHNNAAAGHANHHRNHNQANAAAGGAATAATQQQRQNVRFNGGGIPPLNVPTGLAAEQARARERAAARRFAEEFNRNQALAH